MPLIDNVGRKSPRVIGLFAAMYLLLILGGITMVFPFIIMVSSSMTDEVDYKDFKYIPEYLTDDEVLFRKYLADKYSTPGPNIKFVNERFGEKEDEKSLLKRKTTTLKQTEPLLPLEFNSVPMSDLKSVNSKKLTEDWEEFCATLHLNYKISAFRRVGNSTGPVEKKFGLWVLNKYSNLDALNKAYTTQYSDISMVRGPQERIWDRVFPFDESQIGADFREFKKTLSPDEVYYINGDGPWQTFLRTKYNKKMFDSENIADLNSKNRTNFKDFKEITLPSTLKEATFLKEEWQEFAKTKFPIRYMVVSKKSEPLFKQFLKNKYKNTKLMSTVWEEKITSFDTVKLSEKLIDENRAQYLSCFQEFVAKNLPADLITLKGTENLYRDFVKAKYVDIAKLNNTYGTNFESFGSVRVLYQVFDTVEYLPKKSQLRRYFMFKNYFEVINYIVLHGRAVLNTLIYIVAVILVTLSINPMCAYALSRFKLSYGNKVLLFLLATMAFPAEVGMIPGFLLLKNFHLLNTYWALILPGLANGFSIFILKGFFDSLPKEFYEAAEMDGAGEMKIFLNITLPLAKPVLAYLTLGAFTAAYGAFMFAMLVCQDPNMWTIMVWLYQMWEWAPQHIRMAAYVLASIPTMLVFIFAQRVIMRGIIIPVQH